MEFDATLDYNRTHLQWQGYATSLTQMIKDIWKESMFCDVTLIGDNAIGQSLSAHKLILASSSSVFRELLSQDGTSCPTKSAPLHLKGIQHWDLQMLLNFIYHGEVEVPNELLKSFLRAAASLEISGIISSNDDIHDNVSDQPQTLKEHQSAIKIEENEIFQAELMGPAHEIANVKEIEDEADVIIGTKENETVVYHASIGENNSVISPCGRTNLGITENATYDKTEVMPHLLSEKANERKQELKERINEVLNKEVVCQFCQKLFKSPSRLHKVSDLKLFCEYCSKGQNQTQKNNNDICCLKCILFEKKKLLDKHLEVCSNNTPNNSRKVDSEVKGDNQLYDPHLSMPQISNLICKTCGKEFDGKKTLNDHIRQTHPSQKFNCNSCPNSFHSISNLNRHVNLVHEKIRWECSICHKKLLGNKATHEKRCKERKSIETKVSIRVHSIKKERKKRKTKPKERVCTKCDIQFTSRHGLYNHNRRCHSDIRPFQCSTCGKQFYRKDALDSHQATHVNKRKRGPKFKKFASVM